MEKLIGIVANINNKYVILDDKHYIKENSLLCKILPHDTVEYNILDKRFFEYYGFTQQEVEYLLNQYEVPENLIHRRRPEYLVGRILRID